MNLISRTHNLCERKEYAFNVLPEYSIITEVVSLAKRAVVNINTHVEIDLSTINTVFSLSFSLSKILINES